MRFVLVHSPVVGPSTWRWVGERLRSLGHDAVVPDLTDAARSGDPGAFVRAAVGAATSGAGLVIVGHSGAGPLLPAITNGLGSAVRLTVWVDAGLPPCDGSFTVGGDFLGTLRGLARDGVLPRWSQWFGEGALERLVGDDLRRDAVARELPQLPLAFYEASIDAPLGWCRRAGAYLLLSLNYRSDADRAAALGWPVVEHIGAHLDIVDDEATIADVLVGLAGSTLRSSSDSRSK